MKFSTKRAKQTRHKITPSLFRRMTPAESRQARAIAYRAARAVLG